MNQPFNFVNSSISFGRSVSPSEFRAYSGNGTMQFFGNVSWSGPGGGYCMIDFNYIVTNSTISFSYQVSTLTVSNTDSYTGQTSYVQEPVYEYKSYSFNFSRSFQSSAGGNLLSPSANELGSKTLNNENANGVYTNPSGPYTSWASVSGDLAGRTAKEVASAGKFVSNIAKYGKGIGVAGEIISNGVNVANIIDNPNCWSNYGRLTVSLGTTALNFIPIVGPALSFVVCAIDASGGFDSFYHYIDDNQSLYTASGYVSIYVNGMPTLIKLK
jgi:hypothetical protein